MDNANLILIYTLPITRPWTFLLPSCLPRPAPLPHPFDIQPDRSLPTSRTRQAPPSLPVEIWLKIAGMIPKPLSLLMTCKDFYGWKDRLCPKWRGGVRWFKICARDWWRWQPRCIPACDLCWKTGGGYHKRSTYLSAYVALYVRHEDLIQKSKLHMPRINWHSNNDCDNGPERTAPNALHTCETSCTTCDCDIAQFIRTAFRPCDNFDTTPQAGLKQIVGRYRTLSSSYWFYKHGVRKSLRAKDVILFKQN